MNSVDSDSRELEHHQLERRFAALRVPDARALERLSRCNRSIRDVIHTVPSGAQIPQPE